MAVFGKYEIIGHFLSIFIKIKAPKWGNFPIYQAHFLCHLSSHHGVFLKIIL